MLLVVRCKLKMSCTYTIGHTVAAKANSTEPLAAEDRRLRESAGIPSLVEPRQVTVEAALGTQNILESPEVVPVPKQKFGVAVDIGRQRLVKCDKILISRSRLAELAGWAPSLQASDRADESLPVAVAVRIPLSAHPRVGARRGGADGIVDCERAERRFVLLFLGFGKRLCQRLGERVSEVLEAVLYGLSDVLENTRENFIECEQLGELLGVEFLQRNRGRNGRGGWKALWQGGNAH